MTLTAIVLGCSHSRYPLEDVSGPDKTSIPRNLIEYFAGILIKRETGRASRSSARNPAGSLGDSRSRNYRRLTLTDLVKVLLTPP
jgi:hypothetical protein